MKTLDGFELKEGDECWVSCQCAGGIHHISPSPRKAFYRDETALKSGWDFTTIKPFKADCGEIEIIAYWKNKPENKIGASEN